jgi:hypothetical protein
MTNKTERRFYAEYRTFAGTYSPAVWRGDPPGRTATGSIQKVRNVHELLCERSLHCTLDELRKHFNDEEKLDIESKPL